jgi:pilus assembly protein CpaB
VRNNNIVILFVAIAMGGIAAFLVRNWLESHSRASVSAQPTATIVVASKPLAFGTLVTAENVTEIPWSAKALPEGAFRSTAEILADGRRVVLSALEENEPILHSKVTGPGQRASLSLLVREGKRAVTVRVDDVRGVAGFILPGDFVDVVLIQAEVGTVKRDSYSEILLQHVRVLAIDQLANERQEQPTVAKAVTLEVTPDQAQKILLASNIGKLSLILRQPGEVSVDPSRRVTEADLSPAAAKVVTRPAVAPAAPVVREPVRQPDTATVAVVRNMKREDYIVMRDMRSTLGSDLR